MVAIYVPQDAGSYPMVAGAVANAAITGTTSETQMSSITIPASKYAVGAMIQGLFGVRAGATIAGTVRVRLGSLAGVQLASVNYALASQQMRLILWAMLTSPTNLRVSSAPHSVGGASVAAVADQTVVAGDPLVFVFSIQPGASLDTYNHDFTVGQCGRL